MLDNWSVVEVIIALVGLFFVVAKPLIENGKTMEKLIVSMDNLSSDLKELEKNNTNTHKRLFNKLDEQEEKLDGHEVRIKIIEGKITEE